MNVEEIREYFLSKKAATESTPFDNVTLVFKVQNKMFGLLPLDSASEGNLSFNVKCDPEKAIRLREEFHFVNPGFHMNKKHWNTISIQDPITQKQIIEWIDDSYDLIVAKLSRKLRDELGDY